jgi:hypothetical protein
MAFFPYPSRISPVFMITLKVVVKLLRVEKMLTNQGLGFVNSDYLLQICWHYPRS